MKTQTSTAVVFSQTSAFPIPAIIEEPRRRSFDNSSGAAPISATDAPDARLRKNSVSNSSDKEIPRKIHFYWVSNGLIDNKMIPFSYEKLCDDINNLPADDRYMTPVEGVVTTSRIFEGNISDRFMLGKVRRGECPLTEKTGGEWNPLVLPADVSIADIIHVMFFEGNVMGVEFNKEGPWPTKIREYVQDRFGAKYEKFYMASIIDKNAMERLNNIANVKGVDISLSQPTLQHIPTQQQAKHYFDVLNQIPDFGDAGVINIGWHTPALST